MVLLLRQGRGGQYFECTQYLGFGRLGFIYAYELSKTLARQTRMFTKPKAVIELNLFLRLRSLVQKTAFLISMGNL